jgi:hypothetical protein
MGKGYWDGGKIRHPTTHNNREEHLHVAERRCPVQWSELSGGARIQLTIFNPIQSHLNPEPPRMG